MLHLLAIYRDGDSLLLMTKEKKQQIVDMGGSINNLKSSFGDFNPYNRTKNTEYADYIQSAAAAIQNLLLTAHFRELGIRQFYVCKKR